MCSLARPLNYDEIFTWQMYASRDLLSHVFTMSYPNNHLMNTLAIRICTAIFGFNNLTIRLPALVAGMVTVLVLPTLFRCITGRPRGGFLSAVLYTVSSTAILYDSSARGYSGVCCCASLVALVTASTVACRVRQGWILAGICSALGLFYVPTFLLFLVALFAVCWCFIPLSLWSFWSRAKFSIGAAIVCGGVTGVLWTPTLLATEFAVITDNRFVSPLAMNAFLSAFRSWLFDVVAWIFSGWHYPALFILLPRVVHEMITRGRKSFPIINGRNLCNSAAALFACAASIGILLLVRKNLPPARVFTFVVPFFWIAVEFIFSKSDDTLTRRLALATGSLLVSVVIAARPNEVQLTPGGDFHAADACASYLSASIDRKSVDVIVGRCPVDVVLPFVMRMNGLEDLAARVTEKFPGLGTAQETRRSSGFLVIKNDEQCVQPEFASVMREVFSHKDCTVYRFDGLVAFPGIDECVVALRRR
jgi:hypothetical protein